MEKTNKITRGIISPIEVIVLFIFLAWEFILCIANFFGLAWWASVHTEDPYSDYLFGPFLFRSQLENSFQEFLLDISSENPKSIKYDFIRHSFFEPLTISNCKNIESLPVQQNNQCEAN